MNTNQTETGGGNAPRESYVESLISKWDRRDWTKLPAQFELDAVHKAFSDIKHLFRRSHISSRILASEADNFNDLRSAAARIYKD